MSTEITFVDTYLCPQCKAELETGSDGWQGWRRCPACGLPSLPPESTSFLTLRRIGPAPTVVDDALTIPGDRETPAADDSAGLAADGQPSHVSGARLILRTGLLVSIVLAFIFFLDRRTTNTVIFAALSLAFFLLLLRTSGRRRSAW